MKRILVFLCAGAVSAGICLAQERQSQANGTASGQSSVTAVQSGAQASENASANAVQSTKVPQTTAEATSTSHLQAGSTLQAELVKPVDAKKNKVGDEVIAKTTHDVKSDGHVVIPKGSKLVGHVSEVKARSKEQHVSQLGIAFDRAILKDGTEMPLTLSIQAIGSGSANAAALEDETLASGNVGATGSSSASRGGGVLGGVRSTAGGVANTAGTTAGTAVNSVGNAGGAVSGSLSANSQGVVGLPGLSLSTQSSTSANASVITSQAGNVHLDSGTEMILRANQ